MTLPNFSSIWMKALVVILAGVVVIACKFYFRVADTNPIEVAAEEVIKEETGYDVEPIISKIP
jgi:hypothetical protein